MDLNLPRLYKDYGEYSNYRNFPLDLDGLKPVERRVLLSAFKIAKNKFVKSRQVDAYTIGHYHPHGECYGTIVQLVKQGFLEGQGNFGSSVGVEPVGAAAPRYTECKIKQRTIDLAFKYIDHVPWQDTELSDREPEFLPTMLPLCLIGTEYTQGIGFGYKTFIPCYEVRDLQQRLLWLLGERKRKPIISPITNCNITATQKEIETLLTKGQAKIDVEGIIEEHPRNSTVILKSWPPGKRFESFLGKFSKELNENMIGFTDLSVTNTEILFQVIRERNRTKIYQEFVEKMKEMNRGTISFENVLVDSNQKVIIKPVDQMLLDTYNMFCKVNEVMLNDEITKIKEVINEYNLLEIIRKPLASCIGKGLDIDQTIDELKKAGIKDIDAVRELIKKYRIQKLLTLSTDTTTLTEKVEYLSQVLSNIKQFVLEQYNEFI